MGYPQGADWLGYVAAILVFCSFYVKTIVALRLVAITSNMAFIGYAFAKGLYPVLILHVVLLPFELRAAGAVTRDDEAPEAGPSCRHWTSQSISERSLPDVAPQD